MLKLIMLEELELNVLYFNKYRDPNIYFLKYRDLILYNYKG